MKRYLIKISFYFIPLCLSYIACLYWGNTDGGGLLRVGVLIDHNPEYLEIFEHTYHQETAFNYLSRIIEEKQKRNYKALVIGDSFSNQGNKGFKNFLANDHNMDIIYMDNYNSPINDLYGVINGDILDSINVDYVILESVERYFIQRLTTAKKTNKIYFTEFNTKKTDSKPTNNGKITPLPKRAILFPIYNFLYLFSDNAVFSDTYKVKTSEHLFSSEQKELLFYMEDLENLDINNNKALQMVGHNELNTLTKHLEERNIKLIVVPAPDKYSVYHNYIINKDSYPKPTLINTIAKLQKNYIFINTENLFQKKLPLQKDIYYHGDTHWSPLAAKMVADKIATHTTTNNQQ